MPEVFGAVGTKLIRGFSSRNRFHYVRPSILFVARCSQHIIITLIKQA